MAKGENNCFALIEELITKIKISKILELVEPAFSNLLTSHHITFKTLLFIHFATFSMLSF